MVKNLTQIFQVFIFDVEKTGLFAEDPWSLFFGTSQDTEMKENYPLHRG